MVDGEGGAAVSALVERLFREEAGRLTAILTRLLGPGQLALAEDVVQEAFITALRSWSLGDLPANPSAWLLQVARRKALDALRRERAFEERIPEITAELDAMVESQTVQAHGDGLAADEADPFADERLRMILLCCHPAVSADTRVALTLKTVSGFSVGEIARAFVADERAVAQRLVRAKKALRDSGASFEMPAGAELLERLDAVHDVVYLMFNEGHTAHEGDALLRRDLCDEALRLAERLARDARTARPETHALAALFCFHSSRFDARLGADGAPLRLAEQDRAKWDQARIARGFAHLADAMSGERLSTFHVEAEIASLHAIAPSWDSTDWSSIVAAYDRLLALAPSPVAALNRIVALRMRTGAEAAWKELRALTRDPVLERYPLTSAVRADLLTALGRLDEARSAWIVAREALGQSPLQAQVDQRLAELDTLLVGGDVDSAEVRPS